MISGTKNGGDYNDCHEMKEPNSSRYEIILSTIDGGTMPPAGDSTEMKNMYSEQSQSEVNEYFEEAIRDIRAEYQKL